MPKFVPALQADGKDGGERVPRLRQDELSTSEVAAASRNVSTEEGMMDSGTAVPTRPTSVRFQQAGFGDKGIPGGRSNMSKGPGA